MLIVEGATPETVMFHLELLHSGGFYRSPRKPPHWRYFKSLSWEGADFIDSVRDDKIWQKTKEGAQIAGGFSFEILKALAKGFIIEKIKNHTGINLEE